MVLNFTLRPGVSPLDRGVLEDAVMEVLSAAPGREVDCLGGGGMVDGSESDFTLSVEGLSESEAVARAARVFVEIQFTLPTEVTVSVSPDDDSESGSVHTLPTAPMA